MTCSKVPKNNELGISAMREALLKANDVLTEAAHHNLTEEYINECLTLIHAAFAVPVRNCDVGTLTEQQQRFHNFCEKMQHTDKACCGGCPIVHLRMQGIIGNSCELAWAQMPYEEEK